MHLLVKDNFGRCHQFFCFRSSHQPSSECGSGSGWQVSLQISSSLSTSSVPGCLARISTGAAHLQRCSQPLSRGRRLGGGGGEWNCWNICHLPCWGCQQCWRSHWSVESSMIVCRGQSSSIWGALNAKYFNLNQSFSLSNLNRSNGHTIGHSN